MAGTAPNGAPNSPPIGAVHFGNFHDEIHEKIQTLRSGMSTVDNAVTGLSNTFGKYQKIVRTVGKRYDNDKDLEDENSELKAANKEFLRMAQEDRDDYEKRITEQKRRHEEEVATLLDQANAGEQEKRRYEEMEKKLTEQHDLLRQKTAKDLKQRKAQLEKENVDKIAALKEEKVALESSKGELEEQLRQRTVERNQEMEARQTMQTTLNAEITKLENALNDIQAKYRVEPRSSDF